MSIDKSLKSRGGLQRHRSVLTRAERVRRLEEEERWSEEDSVLGLPKVRAIRVKRTHGRHPKAEEAASAESTEAEGD